MTITDLTRYMTPAEQGMIFATVDDWAGVGDDEAFDRIRDDLYLNAELDLDYSAAERMAYSIVHDCKRI